MRYLLMGAALALSFCSFEVFATEEEDQGSASFQVRQVPPPVSQKPKPVAQLVRRPSTKILDFSNAALEDLNLDQQR